MNKLFQLQWLRAAAALMVVFFHAHIYLLPQKIEQGASIFPGFNMGYSGVEIFFVISGFIMWYIHKKDMNHPAQAPRYLLKRVVRVYPLYWLVFGGLLALYFIFPETGPENARDLRTIIESATLLPLPYTPIMEVAWTLQHEMFFYLAFMLLILNYRIGLGLFVLWMIGCAANLFIDTESFPTRFIFSAYNILFVFGIVAAQYLPKLKPQIAKYLTALGLICYLAIGLSEAYGLIEWYKPLRTVLYGLSAMLLMSITAMPFNGEGKCTRLLQLLGDASYSIYLIHMPCMLITAELLKRIGILHVLPAPLMFIGLITWAVLCSVIVHIVIERRLQLKRSGPPKAQAP